MQGSRLKTRLFLVGLFLVLLGIAAVGWVVRPFTAMATWGASARRARSWRWAGAMRSSAVPIPDPREMESRKVDRRRARAALAAS